MPNLIKSIEISNLLDVYGKLLSANQQQIMQAYYYQDYTLSEIAEANKISRQAVLDAVAKSEKKLLSFEQKVGMYSLITKVRNLEETGKISNSTLNKLLD